MIRTFYFPFAKVPLHEIAAQLNGMSRKGFGDVKAMCQIVTQDGAGGMFVAFGSDDDAKEEPKESTDVATVTPIVEELGAPEVVKNPLRDKTMIGGNVLKFNQATMVEAIQVYLKTQFLDGKCPRVTNVEQNKEQGYNGTGIDFVIIVNDQEKT